MANITNNAVRTEAAAMLMREHDTELMLTAYDQLRPSERIFVDVYVATDSPIKAINQAMPGLHSNLPNVRALEMMRKPLVQAAIADKIRKATEKYRITLDRTLEEIAKIAYANVDDIQTLDENGVPRLRQDVDRNALAAVAGFDVKQIGKGDDAQMVITVKMHDKNSALDKAMKYLGAYQNSDTNVNVNVTNNIDNRSVTVNMTPEQAALEYAKSLEE